MILSLELCDTLQTESLEKQTHDDGCNLRMKLKGTTSAVLQLYEMSNIFHLLWFVVNLCSTESWESQKSINIYHN